MYFFTIAAAAAYLGFSVVQAGALAERAVVNGPCTGSGGAPGVCIPTAKCSEKGGKFINNACPNTPDNIKCCTKASCGNGGDCRWASACQGTTLNNQCPGPASFKCCVPKRPGDTGDNGSPFPKPRLPTVGACQAKAVNGAKKIIEANPGDTREIQCKRGCECEPKNPKASDHCCGMAVDLMCSSKAGVKFIIFFSATCVQILTAF